MFGQRKRGASKAEPASKKKGASRTDAGWEAERKRNAIKAAAKSFAGRDVGDDLPAVADQARKDRAKASFQAFCETYFPRTFYMGWSDDHLRAIALIEQVVRNGGCFALAMPRGSGKTSLIEAAVAWATLYGLRSYVVVIGSDEASASGLMTSVKSELEKNDLLAADFPEVCHPIKKLEGIAQRAGHQHCKGERTHIRWTANRLVLPTMPGSPASGAIIDVAGLTGQIRGKRFKRPDGRAARPDLALIDDPQTDESARSPSQCKRRIKIITGAVIGLAGPGQKIAGIMPCTVIAPGDMADELLDRDRHPEWQGQRTKMVYQWPADEGLWQTYTKIRADSLRAGNEGREATEFYREHRAAMDAGSKVAWPARHNKDELSAIQGAMNLRVDLGDAAFFAEYQNDPIADEGENHEYLTADQIANKINNRDRSIVPREATKLVAFIDVQKAALPWLVAAFEDDFTGYVIDYGFFPEQPGRDYYALADIRRTLADVLKTDSTEASIAQGLAALTEKLLGREWQREDGTVVRVDRCCIDANWGESSDVVYQFCRQSVHAAILVPTHGRYVGAAGRGFNEYKAKPGDEIGDHWRRPAIQNKRSVRYGLFDANHWKTFMQERLLVPLGGRGCLSLFGDEPETHRLLADHLTAETGVKVTARDKTVTEWKIKPTRPDNHWLDCLVGCCVAASMLRISLAERRPAEPRKKVKVKLSELQKKPKR